MLIEVAFPPRGSGVFDSFHCAEVRGVRNGPFEPVLDATGRVLGRPEAVLTYENG